MYSFCCTTVWIAYCCSVSKLRLTLCNPIDCSTPGFPILHHLLEFAQIHVHWVGDTIQPSDPLLPPSPQSFSASGSFPKSWLFATGDQSISISASASVLPMNVQDWFPLGRLVGSSCSPRDSQESSPTTQFKRIDSSVLSFLYSPTLTSIHDYWKNYIALTRQTFADK